MYTCDDRCSKKKKKIYNWFESGKSNTDSIKFDLTAYKFEWNEEHEYIYIKGMGYAYRQTDEDLLNTHS